MMSSKPLQISSATDLGTSVAVIYVECNIIFDFPNTNCPSNWKYWYAPNKGWIHDETIKLTCEGNRK